MGSSATTENTHSFRALRLALVAAALVAIGLPTGCVRRRLNVRSNPPGALVFVDNQEIGTTPCSVDFVYYGTREIRLVKPGYETLTVNQPIPTPWYQIPPIDFVSDNLLPNQIDDHRTVAFNLEPQIIVPTEQLIERGNQLRQETLAGAAAPPPPATVVIPGPGGPPGIAAPGVFTPGTIAPGSMPAPTLAPAESFAPAPTLAPPPGMQPTPLPPVGQPYGQPLSQPPSTAAPYTQSAPMTFPATPSPATSIPATSYPATINPAITVPAAPPGTYTPTPAPFSPPALSTAPPANTPPANTQQGPPITSPPLR